jgi:hypothetical protein
MSALKAFQRGKMYRNDQQDLPYFDETGNDYVREIRRQDLYIKRGGKLTAPQQIKYENRVSMLVERLVLIMEAVKEDPNDLRDYLLHIEQTNRKGTLPTQVYAHFKKKIEGVETDTGHRSERDRDRFRVISGGEPVQESNLSELPIQQLIEMFNERTISSRTLFHEFEKREKSGKRLPKIDGSLWSRYRSWLADRRRNRRPSRTNES